MKGEENTVTSGSQTMRVALRPYTLRVPVPLVVLFVFISGISGCGTGQSISFVDLRDNGGPGPYFSYLSYLKVHPKPLATGFLIEHPPGLGYWDLSPISSPTRWALRELMNQTPRTVVNDPNRSVFLGLATDSSILQSKDGNRWEVAANSAKITHRLVCETFCRGGECEEWAAFHFCGQGEKGFYRPSSPRFVAVAHYGNRFWGVITTTAVYPPLSPLVVSSSDGISWKREAILRQMECDKGLIRLVQGASSMILSCNPLFDESDYGWPREFYLTKDGRFWREIKLPAPEKVRLSGLLFAEQRFVVVGSDGYAYVSFDGENWSRIPVIPALSLNDLTYGKGSFVAVGDQGVVATSQDGLRWQHQSIANQKLLSVAFSNGYLLVAEAGGRLHLSQDGRRWHSFEPWSIRGLEGVAEFVDVTYGKAGYIAVALTGEIAHSFDGQSWSLVHKSPKPLYTARWGGSGYVVGGKEQILYSDDGHLWRTVSQETMDSVAFGPAGFVGIGGWYHILFSKDGLSWQKRSARELGLYHSDPKEKDFSTPDDTALQYVAFGEGRYLVVGNWMTSRRGRLALFSSDDAESWKQLDVGCTEPALGLTFTGKRFLIAGWGEIMAFPPGNGCIDLELDRLSGPWLDGDIVSLGIPFIRGVAGNDEVSQYAILNWAGSVFSSRNLRDWVAVANGNFRGMTMGPGGRLVVVGKDIAVVDLVSKTPRRKEPSSFGGNEELNLGTQILRYR